MCNRKKSTAGSYGPPGAGANQDFRAIRACFQRSEHAPRWYQASADPRLGPALSAMHADPARPWTVPELAAISGLSRAAFARIFQLALGQAPMQYLTE
jgi:transcriptional regulator GlxA family with amidase domain